MYTPRWFFSVLMGLTAATWVSCSSSDNEYEVQRARLDTTEIGMDSVYTVRMTLSNPHVDTFLVAIATLQQGDMSFTDSTGFYLLKGDSVITELVFPEARTRTGESTFTTRVAARPRK